MRALLLALLLAPSLAFAQGPSITRMISGGGPIVEVPRCDFAYQLPGVKSGEYVCDTAATPVTTARAGGATCIAGHSVAANVACISAGGLECFAAGTGGRTAADAHTVPTAGWPKASGDIRLRFTPTGSRVMSVNRYLVDTRSGATGDPAGDGVALICDGFTDRVIAYVRGGGVDQLIASATPCAAAGVEAEYGLRWIAGVATLTANGTTIGTLGSVTAPTTHRPAAIVGANLFGTSHATGSIRLLRVSP